MCELPHKYIVHCSLFESESTLLSFLLFSIQGMALVFAPLRGETLELFCQLAQQAGLCVSQHQQYDAQVWDVHLKVRSLSKSREKDLASQCDPKTQYHER